MFLIVNLTNESDIFPFNHELSLVATIENHKYSEEEAQKYMERWLEETYPDHQYELSESCFNIDENVKAFLYDAIDSVEDDDDNECHIIFKVLNIPTQESGYINLFYNI